MRDVYRAKRVATTTRGDTDRERKRTSTFRVACTDKRKLREVCKPQDKMTIPTTTTTPPPIEGSLGHGHLALFRYSHGDCAVTPMKHVSNKARAAVRVRARMMGARVCACAYVCVCVCRPHTHSAPSVSQRAMPTAFFTSVFTFHNFTIFRAMSDGTKKKQLAVTGSRELRFRRVLVIRFLLLLAGWLAGWLPPCSATRYNTTTSSVVPARPRSGYPHPFPSPRRASLPRSRVL